MSPGTDGELVTTSTAPSPQPRAPETRSVRKPVRPLTWWARIQARKRLEGLFHRPAHRDARFRGTDMLSVLRQA